MASEIKGPQVQRPIVPATPTKTGKVGVPDQTGQATGAKATEALGKLELAALSGNMSAAQASISGGGTANVLGGMKSAQTASTAAAGDIPQSAFSLESLGIALPGETSAAGMLSGFPKPSAKDRQALNSELANVFGKLSEKLGEAQANKLKTVIQSAGDIAAKLAEDPQLQQTLKEAVRLGKALNNAEGLSTGMGSMSANLSDAEAAAADATTRLNGEGGKAFGEIGDIIGKGTFKNIDLSNMPIEDAIQMMFMLISEDARKDTKELLIDMDAIRKQKAALREATTLTKEQNAAARQQARDYYDDMVKNMTPEERAGFAPFDTWIKSQQMQSAVIETNAETGTAELKTPASFVVPEAPLTPGSGGTLTTETPAATVTTSPAATVTTSPAATVTTSPAATVTTSPTVTATGATILTAVLTNLTYYTMAPTLILTNKTVTDFSKFDVPVWQHGKQYQIENPADPVINPVRADRIDVLQQHGITDTAVFDVAIDQHMVNGMGRFTGNQEVETSAQRLESDPPTETIGGKVSSFETAEVDLGRLQDAKDSLSEQSEQQQLKMQMYMDRMTKADSARSNTMKKFSEIASQIIGNWK